MKEGSEDREKTELPPAASPLPHFPICYVLTSPLTHKSNTVELNSICTLRDSKQGGRWMWTEAEWGGRRTESREGGREMTGRSIGPWTVTLLTRFHIHLSPLPSIRLSLMPLSLFLWQASEILQALPFGAHNNLIEWGINGRLRSVIRSCSPNHWLPDQHALTANMVHWISFFNGVG